CHAGRSASAGLWSDQLRTPHNDDGRGAAMIPADRPVQRPRDARLLVIDASGRITHVPRTRLVDALRPGDVVIANDAATLPASLHGVHLPSRAEVEVRLAGRAS